MTATQRRRVLVFLPVAAAAAGVGLARAETLRGSGRVVEQTRPLPAFDAVAVEGGIDVVVSRAPQATAAVSVDDNLQPLLETVVDDEGGRPTLRLRWKRGTIVAAATPRVRLALPRLAALGVAGAGSVRLQSWSAPSLQLSIAGSGRVTLDELTADELAVKVAGSGDVRGAGKVGRLSVSISGSGDVRLDALTASDASVTISGSGDAAVHADRTLAVSIAGSGDVVHSGSAQPQVSIAGSGRVRRKA